MKNKFKHTMLDERLISTYKDEIKQELSESLDIDLQEDAINVNQINDGLLEKTRNEYFKNNKKPTSY